MGRKSGMGSSIEQPRVRFVALKDSRRFVQFDMDMTNGSVSLDGLEERAAVAVVKLVVTYNHGDELRAAQLAAEAGRRIKKVAAHMYRPVMIAIGSQKTRAPEVKVGMSPVDAVREWLKVRPPKIVERVKGAGEWLLERTAELAKEMSVVSRREVQAREFRISEVQIQDLLPFSGIQKVTLGPGVYGIVGRYKDGIGRSNRAGKTAFLEAIQFALYGEGRKVRTADRLIHHGATTASSQVRLDPSGVVFTRSISAAGGKTKVNGEVVKREAALELAVKETGLTGDDFLASCFVRQGDLHGMLGQPNAKIRADLSRWLGLQAWDVLLQGARERREAEEARLREARNALDTARRMLEDIQPVSEAEISEAEEALDVAKRAVSKLAEDEGRGAELRSLLLRKRAILDAFEAKEPSEAEVRKVESKAKEANALAERAEFCLMSLNQERTKVKAALRGEFDGQCPVTGKECPAAAEINTDRRTFKKRLAVLEAEIAEARRQSIEAKRVADELDRRLEDYANLSVRAAATAEIRNEFGGKVPDFDRAAEQLRLIESGAEASRKAAADVSAASSNLSLLRERKSRRQVLLDRIAAAEATIAPIAEQVDLWRCAQFMFGRSGVPGLMIENGVAVLEGRANEVLREMGSDIRLKFSFEVELKRKALECPQCGQPFGESDECPRCGEARGMARAEEVSIRVVEGGGVQDFEQDSGGGKDLLALAVRIGLCQLLGVRVLFLDEICGSLDDENLRALIRLVTRLPEMGFDQVFVISHRPEVADAMPRRIVAERDQDAGSSRLWVE